MKRIRDSFVSSTGAASISLAVAVAPSNPCNVPMPTGDTGGADDSGAVDHDAGAEPADASAPDASAPVDASFTEAMASSSPDAAPSTDAGGAPPPTLGRTLCLSQWPQPAGIQVDNTFVATDATGNAYVVIDYAGPLPQTANGSTAPIFNLGVPPSRVPAGFAVAKFDEGCNLVWVREFGPQVPVRFGAGATGVATDAQGNVTIVGAYEGTADFGAGAVTAGSSLGDGILLRLDPSGATVFARPFVNARPDATMTLFNLAVTPAGVTTIPVQANTDTDFGSGQEFSLFGPATDYEIVQFDGAGKVLFRKPLLSINPLVGTITQIATNASGFLWAVGTETSPFNSVALPPQRLLVGVTASGTYAWQQALTTASGVAAGPAGAVLYTSTYGNPEWTETLQGLAADGSSTWTTSTPAAPFLGNLVVDGRGEPVVLGTFTGSATFGSAPPLTSVGGRDLDYQLFDSTGHLVSIGSWGTPDDEGWNGSVGVDSSGNIAIAATSLDPMATRSNAVASVSFVKFAR